MYDQHLEVMQAARVASNTVLDVCPAAIWFTSDTHFGHKNIIGLSARTRGMYRDLEDMDARMIARWNSLVGPDDLVYHLGDFTWYDKLTKIKNILHQLNGHIHLILGNHDRTIIKHRTGLVDSFEPARISGTFSSIQDYKEIDYNGIKVVMFHFPMAVWHKNHHGSFHVFGHCHGSFPGYGKSMDVGWDTANLGPTWTPGPINAEIVARHLTAQQLVVLDHHTPNRLS